MNPFKEIIEEAKNKAKAQFGEGHYMQTPFWQFILQVEKIADSGRVIPKGELLDYGCCGFGEETLPNRWVARDDLYVIALGGKDE